MLILWQQHMTHSYLHNILDRLKARSTTVNASSLNLCHVVSSGVDYCPKVLETLLDVRLSVMRLFPH